MGDALRTRPERLCDIVMKGGITSGVVYPRAVCALAGAYRLKNVGGTSAGAIAAAGAAAAEYGREQGGFERLAELPAWIGGAGNLVGLFQPQPSTRGLFRILVAAVDHDRRKLGWAALAAVRAYPLATLAGALPGLGIALVGALTAGDRPGLLAAVLVAAVLLALIGAAAGIALRLRSALTTAVPANDFGICSGMPGADAGGPALTPWLDELVDGLASRPAGARPGPLTFAELWAGPGGDLAAADPEDAWMRLEMMTTNLTNRRAERLPWATAEFFFDPAQLRRLFPERIVAWLEAHPRSLPSAPAERRDEQMLRALLWPLRPLPHAADLPVVVATRMSLSFPLLLSAVPLRRVDWTRVANREARRHWREWLKEHAAEFDAVADDPARAAALTTGGPRPAGEVCWFSDGGIASNFPVHFFDAFVPRHPTFAINLRPFHPDDRVSDDECENVWMVDRHPEGISDWWYRFDGAADRALPGFLAGIVQTMQNRVDEAQMRLPGYRDRVVHVSLTEAEGGMNLTMPPEAIERLTARGRCAGERLVERFARPPSDPKALSWDDHRWVRYRSSIAALAAMLRQFARGYGDESAPSYGELLARGDDEPPSSYRVTAGQRALARELSDGMVALAQRLEEAGVSLADDAPSPPPGARIVPEDQPVRKRGAAA